MSPPGDEVVVEPARLDDVAGTIRRHLLRVDVDRYRDAILDHLHASSDLSHGHDLRDLSHRVDQVLADVELVNRSAEDFAAVVADLDHAHARRGVVTTTLSGGRMAHLRQRWARLAGTDLLQAAAALEVVRALDAEVDAGLPTATPGAVANAAAAGQRIASLLATLVDLGVDDDADLQAAVVAHLGPDGLTAFATRLADLEAAAGAGVGRGPVPWLGAAMTTMATWTGSAAAAMDDDELRDFLDAVPARLVGALDLLGSWPAGAVAVAAASVWDRSAPDTTFRLPDSARPRAWDPDADDRELAATMLASNARAAHHLLTGRPDILAGLVAQDDPAAARAVLAGLVQWPRSQWSTTRDTSTIRDSARAFADLVDRDVPLGGRTLPPGGRVLLERVADFHFGLVEQGVMAAVRAFLGGASGTYGPVVDAFLRHELAARPTAVDAIAGRMDAGHLRTLVATLADPDVAAHGALVRVGRHVGRRLATVDAPGAAGLLDDLGPQALADLTSAAVSASALDVLGELGDGYARALTALPTHRQVDSLELLSAADDAAGYAAVLLANADGLSGDLLPLLLHLDGPTFLLPHSDQVIELLGDGGARDWRAWSAPLYTSMFADHDHPFDLVLAATSASSPVSIGLSTAFGDLLEDRPEVVDPHLQDDDRGFDGGFATMDAVMAILHPSGSSQRVIDSYAEQELERAARSSQVHEPGPCTPTPSDPGLVEGTFTLAGENIGALQRFAHPEGWRVDGVGLSRVVIVNVAEKVPVLGTITSGLDDAWSLHQGVQRPRGNAAAARGERTRILAAIDFLTQEDPHRAQILGDFGFELRQDGTILSRPDATEHDLASTLRRHPEYTPLLDAADGFADGLATGRRLPRGPAD